MCVFTPVAGVTYCWAQCVLLHVKSHTELHLYLSKIRMAKARVNACLQITVAEALCPAVSLKRLKISRSSSSSNNIVYVSVTCQCVGQWAVFSHTSPCVRVCEELEHGSQSFRKNMKVHIIFISFLFIYLWNIFVDAGAFERYNLCKFLIWSKKSMIQKMLL